VGQFFRQFGLVIVTATLLSLFVSFTLTPLLASCWYRQGQSGDVEGNTGGRDWNPLVSLARVWNTSYLRLERGYERLLETHSVSGGLRLELGWVLLPPGWRC